ncbi:MAG: aminotransferase class V-fold PLP-dependent enzyme [Rhizobiales bacterium]|nr:aminotransferase class V-fold PLP-dependent enzyme [Hyphomicrobiales bacterium]
MDIDQIREDTPALKEITFMNAAGSSISPECVYNGMAFILDEESRIGGYHAHAKYEQELEIDLYASLAQLINAKPSEIGIVENATIAWQKIFYGLATKWQKGDIILSTTTEYGANLIAFMHVKKLYGVETLTLADTEFGEVDTTAMDAQIESLKAEGKNVVLVSVSHLPSNNGLIQPAAEIGKIANKHNIIYLLDACQSIGLLPVNVQKIGCDFLTTTSRKFLRGPRGNGFLYASSKMLQTFEPAILDFFGAELDGANDYNLRKDARRFENWENAYALRAGLHAAVDYALDLGIHKIWKRTQIVSNKLRTAIAEIPGMHIADLGQKQSAIITCYHETKSSKEIRNFLEEKNIMLTLAGDHSAPWDGEKRKLPEKLRFSPHYYNDENDSDIVIEILKAAVK